MTVRHKKGSTRRPRGFSKLLNDWMTHQRIEVIKGSDMDLEVLVDFAAELELASNQIKRIAEEAAAQPRNLPSLPSPYAKTA